jgi:two-component system response regulator AtoC
MPDIPKILVAEDEGEVRGYLEVALRAMGFEADMVEDGDEAVSYLKENGSEYSLLLLDLNMPRKDGMETLREVRQFDTGLPIIILSSASSSLHIVEAIKNGANDFLPKPVGHEELSRAIQKALRIRPNTPAPVLESPAAGDGACIASSSWTKKLDQFLKQVGSSDVPVLLQGETGVGKEVLGRQIHACSPRAKGPFLKLNCAALPSELIESELFGYERGAFTGAFRSSPGKFEMANGGTILLDEIGDMDFKLQAKLLQVLQDGEFLRLGAKDMCRVDVRVIAATHCDLERAISEGRFREDLYYRLNIIRIEVPPLRERREEILALAQFFMKKHARAAEPPVEITSALRQTLLSHSWPGNIRELENVIRKLLVVRRPELVIEELRRSATHRRSLSDRVSPISEHHRAGESNGDGGLKSAHMELPFPVAAQAEAPEAGEPSALHKVNEARKEAEVQAIVTALNATLWNRKEAAMLLQIDYKALLYKMKKLGIGDKSVAVSATQ